jgi:hypothetical protein
MKSTVTQASWPVPASTPDQAPSTAEPAEKTMSRITLALLDELSEQKSRGYDPYDTRTAPVPKGDLWSRKPKRD